MNPTPPPPWIARTKVALEGLRTSPALLAKVRVEADAFFAAHPDEARDAANEKLVTFLILDRLTGETEAGNLGAEIETPTQGEK